MLQQLLAASFVGIKDSRRWVLYNFCSAPNCADGQQLSSGLIQDAAGNLYGTIIVGGGNGHGVVFELDSTGNETDLRMQVYSCL